MTKQELLNKIEEEIQKLDKEYGNIPENDYVNRGLCLGKINGLLTAKMYVIELQVK